jgi:hypothetical protein
VPPVACRNNWPEVEDRSIGALRRQYRWLVSDERFKHR